GKLMTQELNMIEDGMPGFSIAMAEHLGVPPEKMREMVTAGEVTSGDFLDVMENFAGGMADAYANSWSGMLANTKAYVGQIGEQLLGGVFEQSKESIAEFIEFLKSDEVMEWASRTGEKLGEMFSNLVENVKNLIDWWTGLDSSTQALIGKFSLFVVALGPILSKLGSLLILLPKMYDGFTILRSS